MEESAAIRELQGPGKAFTIWSNLMDKHKHEPFMQTITSDPARKDAWTTLVKVNSQWISDTPILPSDSCYRRQSILEVYSHTYTHTIPAAALAAIETVAHLIDSGDPQQAADVVRQALEDELGENGVLVGD